MLNDTGAQPFFSVVIPLYNKELYIERAIDSVFSQTESSFEVIVVDDGSTDNGAEIIRKFSTQNILVHTQKNEGVSGARNNGVSLASGKWVAFLDADDKWGKGHLSELRKIIELFPEAGMVAASSKEITEGAVEFLNAPKRISMSKINYFNEAARNIGVVHTSSVAINRQALVDLGGFSNHRLGEDLELWARVALHFPVATSNRKTAIYYRGNGGVMEKSSNEKFSKSVKFPLNVIDISPSVAMLYGWLSGEGRDSEMKQSVTLYINSRVCQAIRAAFIRGDVRAMKEINKLFIDPLKGNKYRFWCFFAGLPSFFLLTLSDSRHFAKRLINYIKKG